MGDIGDLEHHYQDTPEQQQNRLIHDIQDTLGLEPNASQTNRARSGAKIYPGEAATEPGRRNAYWFAEHLAWPIKRALQTSKAPPTLEDIKQEQHIWDADPSNVSAYTAGDSQPCTLPETYWAARKWIDNYQNQAAYEEASPEDYTRKSALASYQTLETILRPLVTDTPKAGPPSPPKTPPAAI